MPADRGQSIPPGFWNLPAVRGALDRHDLGTLLALITEHCDMTQHALAALIGMPQPQLWLKIFAQPRQEPVHPRPGRVRLVNRP